jgi:alpha-ketoglutarate-dependent taurine dioxygenase
MFDMDTHEYVAANNVPLGARALSRARTRATLVHTIEGPSSASAADLAAMIVQRRATLTDLLTTHGAILFRGFGVPTPVALAKVVDAAGRPPMRYVGGDSPRTSLGSDVYTSTETPRTVDIRPHNEMSYLPHYPLHIWFSCASEGTRGGETTLTDGRGVYRDLDPAVRDRLDRLGIRYLRSLRGKSRFHEVFDHVAKVTKSWMETFESDDRSVVEARCRELGSQFRWLPSGRLVMETERPAFIRHPVTGEPAWFNQANLFVLNPRTLGRFYYTLSRIAFLRKETRSHHAQWGGGAEIDDAIIAHLVDVIDRNTITLPLRRGDVIWVDNLLCLHGRKPFAGPRKILVAMTS